MVGTIETDYLIVGSGAVGMAFADTLLSQTDADMVFVDRHGSPGGHWNDAYPFVRLHQPSAFYGVDSIPLGSNRKDRTGLNAGYYELASGPEVTGYFDQVMNQKFLPSGRVRYFPMSDYVGDGQFVSLLSGAQTQVNVRAKTVDATYYGTTVPSTHTPKFEIDDGVTLVTPNALPDLWKTPQARPGQYVILGGGKTAMDVGVWLLNSGADQEAIRWVVPRDSWLLNRHHTQPGLDFFDETIGAQVALSEALGAAGNIDDLFERLEASGMMLRIDPDIRPTMYHCATMSIAEVELLRQIKHVIRKGHVTALKPGEMVMDEARLPIDADAIYIDCTASAVERRPPVPIFQGDLITPQMIRTCQPTFSAALVAFLEAHFDSDETKNSLSQVVPLPDGLDEFLPVTLANMMNQYMWSRDPKVRDWLRQSRLDGFSGVISEIAPDDADRLALLDRLRASMPVAIANIQTLMTI